MKSKKSNFKMKSNPFFKKKTIVRINDILNILNLKKNSNNSIINDIKTLDFANKNDITFFHSIKYKNLLDKTKSNYILTTKKYSNFIPKKKNLIIVNNVLISVSKITKLIYPKSLDDNTDDNLSKLKLQNKYRNLKFGNNVLLGKNVLLGSNCYIGHNTIIESNVKIGNNCVIGSNVIIKNSIIGNDVRILDGAIIGKKGFGFFPSKDKNLRYPHIGMVIIGNNVEIGCNNTIDRGSLSNTMIGENTYLDNQIHIAHNVQIGKNCIITAQVGFAGSAKIGNKVMIGGQAGISGHLNIGNNVQIGGGSGVIKNIPDNSKVMGYPAKDIRSFIRESK